MYDRYVLIIIVLVSALILLGLNMAALVSGYIGSAAQNVMNRLLGVIVGALGVEFILEGINGFFKLS